MPASLPVDASLNVARRSRELAELSGGDAVDLLVIGGGVTGVGIALDAASRGLSVALVERRDLAFGTSRWSSKLAHGGLRYLAKGDVAIAWASARERGHLMTDIAPHLVRPLPMVLPLHEAIGRRTAAMLTSGFVAGDVLRMAARTPKATLPHPSRIAAHRVHDMVPATARTGLRGGLLSWDGQLIDDARLVVTIARTAASYGARILTYVSAATIERGRVEVTDELTGAQHVLRARQVVNAAGVWADTLSDDVQLSPSKGSHLLVRAERLGNPTAALTAPVPGHFGRFVFAVPWHDGLVMIGLTDDPHRGAIPERARPDDTERSFLLDTLNAVLDEPLTADDIVGSYAGFRPLLRGEGGPSADLSRKHAIVPDHRTGALTIVGGKLTEYRRMAHDVVDAAIEAAGLTAGPCRTTHLPLVGAGAVDPGLPERLVARYGTDATIVAAYTAGDAGLAERVTDRIPLTGAEIRFAVDHELAVTVDDVVDRRTRWGLVDADREDLVAAVREHAPELIAGPSSAATSHLGGAEREANQGEG
ncbi:glycerol-3-phosphate dehydrogenase/oxidase [Flexivirga sp. B27]